MTNKSRGPFAYTLLDLESSVDEKDLAALRQIESMIRVRVVSGEGAHSATSSVLPVGF